jgi:hypothetical protein
LLDAIPSLPVTVEYLPQGRDATGRARRFTLTLTERTRAGGRPQVTWYDETGLRWEAVESQGRRDSTHIADGLSLRTFLIVQHLVDDHATRHDGEYPLRIASNSRYRDQGSPRRRFSPRGSGSAPPETRMRRASSCGAGN